jgi:CBS domain-containing protein
MAQTIREVMSPNVVTIDRKASLLEAAQSMRDADVGALVTVDEDGGVVGIVTDRDIVVRGLAEAGDASSTTLEDISSEDLVAVGPDTPVDEAVRFMRDRTIRRLPVVEGGQAVGVVSIGDLAVERDPTSALADISAAPPNR